MAKGEKVPVGTLIGADVLCARGWALGRRLGPSSLRGWALAEANRLIWWGLIGLRGPIGLGSRARGLTGLKRLSWLEGPWLEWAVQARLVEALRDAVRQVGAKWAAQAELGYDDRLHYFSERRPPAQSSHQPLLSVAK